MKNVLKKKTTNLFLTVLGAGKSKIKGPGQSPSGEDHSHPSFCFIASTFFLYLHMVEEVMNLCRVPFIRASISFLKPLLS